MTRTRSPFPAGEAAPPRPAGRRPGQRRRWSLPISAALAAALASTAAAKDPFDAFHVQVEFVNATSTADADLDRTRIQTWVATAESMYGTKPSLKISYTIRRQTSVGSTALANLKFDGLAEFGKFMDDHFDNQARTETEGHLTVLVGETLCLAGGLMKGCWGGLASFPHDVNPLGRKRGIWLGRSDGENKYLLAHEIGHFFGLKHTFEPYVGLNLQCNKEFENKNLLHPAIGHCNSCSGRTVVHTKSDGTEYYTCQGGVSNVMDYCRADDGLETLNTCQQERSANQRQQFLTKEGKVDYVALAGLRGEGACTSDAQCKGTEFCTAGVVDLTRNVCKEKKAHGATCTDRRQCQSDRCSWGLCADADECRASSDCGPGQYCGDPVVGQQKCKDLLARGKACTRGLQCASGKCSFLVCK